MQQPAAESGLRLPGAKVLKKSRQDRKANLQLFTLTLPAIILVLIFSYLPMVGVILAFKQYRYDKGIFGSKWVGLKNFEFLFQSEDAFRIFRNTILYAFTNLCLGTLVAVFLAVLMNEIVSRKAIKYYQTTLFFPYFMSWVIVGYLVYTMLDPYTGVANGMIEWLGGEPIEWYREPKYWPYILVLTNLWKGLGFGALFYYAAIIGIDPHLNEAARIDGASRWQIARFVTVPSIMPTVMIFVILGIGGLLNGDFGLHWFVPNMAANQAFLLSTTDNIDTYLYRSLYSSPNLGMQTAVGLFRSLVGIILIVTANYLARKVNEDHSIW